MTLLARRLDELARAPSPHGPAEKTRSVAARPPQPRPSFLHLQAALGNRATSDLLLASAASSERHAEPGDGLAASSLDLHGAAADPRLELVVRLLHAPRPAALLVADDSPAGPTQMTRSAFLAAVREAARAAAEEALTGTGHTARGCPWIEHYSRLYQQHGAERIEADLRRYVPAARDATDARELLARAADHVRASVGHWAATGELTGVPRGLPGMGLVGALASSARAAGVSVSQAVAVQAQLGPGRPLDATARSRMERGFGRRFADVRLHTDAAAARLARRLRARAFAVGRHVAFDRGEYRPGTPVGDALLAHELAHTCQQGRGGSTSMPGRPLEADADRAAAGVLGSLWAGSRRRVQPRLRSGLQLARCEDREFSDAELHAYLDFLRNEHRTEDGGESDDKARAVVARFRRGEGAFVLTPDVVILLISEMQKGATFDDDENAILDLLESLPNSVLAQVFAAGAIGAADLRSDFDGPQEDRLLAFFSARFVGGYDAVRRGVVQPQGGPRLTEAAERRARQTEERDACAVRTPEKCPTYEAWIRELHRLPTFAADDSFTQQEREANPALGGRQQVIGDRPAPSATATDPRAQPSQRRPPVVGGGYLPADRFMDGPTQAWLEANLPPNLIELAYQLPTDCADIAFILHYVWLASHNREVTFGGLTCGARSGRPDTGQVRDDIGNTIHARGGATFVDEYRDERGNPIRSFPALEPLLHPGDILVWTHSGGGGHAETIMDVSRQGERITAIRTVMGNQPIGQEEARQIYGRQGRQVAEVPRNDALREAPGRRLEVRSLTGAQLRDLSTGNWGTEHDGRRTEILVAGPPGPALSRPGARGGVRSLTDWLPRLRAARNAAELAQLLDSILLEARGAVAVARTDDAIRQLSDRAAQIAVAAGQRVWDLAEPDAGSRDRAGTRTVNETHYRVLEDLRAIIRRFRQDASSERARQLFALMQERFNRAARGGESIDFSRRGQGGQVFRVLVTGFDPFRSGGPPRPGDFNPSGQAAIALDGETIPLEGGAVAAVEGVVLPVSFEQFNTGLVESIIGPHLATVDAVITVSLYPRDVGETGTGLRLERFAVGVRLREEAPDQRQAVPPPPGQIERGAAIIETEVPLGEIGSDLDAAGLGPALDNTVILFRFPSRETAQQALGALGLPATATSNEVSISDPAALRRILASMERGVEPESPGIVFTAGRRRFQAIVVRGPGGDFLSNEISFRVLRMLASRPAPRPSSFHVHTPAVVEGAGEAIPQGDRGAARQAALAASHRLVQRLMVIIASVARQRRRP